MNTKRWLRFSIVPALLLTGAYLAKDISANLQRKSVLQRFLHTLPTFQFTALDGTAVGTDYLLTGQPAVLLFFSPDCAYCQEQAQSIAQQLTVFENIQFLWIADDSVAVVHAFAERYGINHKPNSKVVTARYGQIKAVFGIRQLPSVLIYNRQHHFVRHFSGETKWEAILAAVNDQTPDR